MSIKNFTLFAVLTSVLFGAEVCSQELPPGALSPGLIFVPPPPPQPLIPDLEPTPAPKEVKAKEIQIEIQAPPGAKVSVPLAVKSESDASGSDFRFRIPLIYKKVKVNVEGPFGGKMTREISLDSAASPLRVLEGAIETPSTEPDPASLQHLPQICPRLVSKNEVALNDFTLVNRSRISPETAVYDGRRDLLNLAVKEKTNLLTLQSANIRFDSEDASVILGFDPKTGEFIFEKGGGFYSNFHTVVLPYREDLEKLYQSMEDDLRILRKAERELRDNRNTPSAVKRLEEKMEKALEALHGKGEEAGPYQILMHLAFNTLDRIGKQELQNSLGAPASHGFIPGPFLGSRHWGYSLCEWGDTALHAPFQKMQYEHFPLWSWTSDSPDEKIILLVIEGDDQLNDNPGRKKLIERGVLRAADYTDDLIGFFVIRRGSTLKGNFNLSSLLQDFSIQVKTK